MRTIKFRAWSYTKKKMLDRVLAGPGDPCSVVWDEEHKEWLNFDDACGVIMQFTGLTDKHGKDIYEGDILLIGLSEEKRFYPNVVVRWKFNRWIFGTSVDWDFEESYFDKGNVEIIGNIWETPELVAQEQEQ